MTATTYDVADRAALARHKGSTTVAVCLPAHNEEATVGPIVEAIRHDLMETTSLVNRIVVLDDASDDATTRIAIAAGAEVLAAQAVLPAAGTRRGKGEAMWKSIVGVDADIIVWVDADIVDFDVDFVTRLVRPLIEDPNCVFVKGHYARPVGADGLPGGRVTELVARPSLSLYFPHLARFPQPLSGEIAGRRDALRGVSFAAGYGVDVALLIDVVGSYGLGRVASVDLGVRIHRNRPLDQLAPQAFEVLHAILVRAGVPVPADAALVNPAGQPIVSVMADRPALDALPPAWSSG